MLYILSRVDMPTDRSFRLHPHEHTMWEYHDSIREATGEVWNELDAFPTNLLHLLTEILLDL